MFHLADGNETMYFKDDMFSIDLVRYSSLLRRRLTVIILFRLAGHRRAILASSCWPFIEWTLYDGTVAFGDVGTDRPYSRSGFRNIDLTLISLIACVAVDNVTKY